jgi:hypothetical protein
VTEEIELGGLDDDNDNNSAFAGLDDVERPQDNALEVLQCCNIRYFMSEFLT